METKIIRKLDQYNLIQEIGSGASSKVYKALNTQTDEEVAVKVINSDISEKEKNQIIQEMNTLQQITPHENVI